MIKKRLLSIISGIIIAFIGIIIFTLGQLLHLNSYDTVEININGTGKDVFNTLQENNIIKNSDISYYYSRLFHQSDFKAGTYVLNYDEVNTIDDLIDYLSDADNTAKAVVSLTIKDGYWIKDIAKLLSENTILDYDEIIEKWDDHDYLNTLINDYEFLTSNILASDIRHPLEGYLWPDTYEFYTDTTIDEVTRKILDNTDAYYQKYKTDIEASKYSVHELFTLASIVQYESGSEEYSSDIAQVFYNRLDAGMLLQSSVTVCYAIDLDENEDGSACELAVNASVDDPYNTYKYAGLTPGPILSFNETCLKAVLYPNKNDYFYFIADSNGNVIFAKTYAEHKNNICRYLGC